MILWNWSVCQFGILLPSNFKVSHCMIVAEQVGAAAAGTGDAGDIVLGWRPIMCTLIH